MPWGLSIPDSWMNVRSIVVLEGGLTLCFLEQCLLSWVEVIAPLYLLLCRSVSTCEQYSLWRGTTAEEGLVGDRSGADSQWISLLDPGEDRRGAWGKGNIAR